MARQNNGDMCPICDKEPINGACMINGLWKVGTHGEGNKGENRFSIFICINCWDKLQGWK